MKPGVRHRYFNKFKARQRHYLAGKYRLRKPKGDEEE